MTTNTISDFQVRISPTQGLEGTVGNTPLLPLRRVTRHLSPKVQVLVKAEWFNPGGSIKDRPALKIIKTAIERFELPPGKRLLDSTSGNMGIAYATFGAALGIPVTLAIPSNASPERIKILKALGAELILTDPFEGSDGAILAAREMVRQNPDLYYYANQYNNPANWQAHYKSTGPEILSQSAAQYGAYPTHFVVGLGTTGTLMGAGRYLRENVPSIRILSFQPEGPFHGLEGLKHMPTSIKPGIYEEQLADENLSIRTEDGYAMVRRLAREEGLFTGISAGAAVVAAIQVAEKLEHGMVVTVLPDSGYKYLSDRLWESD